ncbi:MAG: hypothetical protein QOC81_4182 [Thermoanaerobaculia bacterium]|nr:hypothetical protein [Thermoanaerobaculia bacterium]
MLASDIGHVVPVEYAIILNRKARNEGTTVHLINVVWISAPNAPSNTAVLVTRLLWFVQVATHFYSLVMNSMRSVVMGSSVIIIPKLPPITTSTDVRSPNASTSR